MATKGGGWYSLRTQDSELQRFYGVREENRLEERMDILSPEDGESVVFTGGIFRKSLLLRAMPGFC